MLLYPKKYFKKITDITFEFLKENKIQGLILDVDNTLIDFNLNVLEGLEQWHEDIVKNGIKTITCLVYGGTFKAKSLFKAPVNSPSAAISASFEGAATILFLAATTASKVPSSCFA